NAVNALRDVSPAAVRIRLSCRQTAAADGVTGIRSCRRPRATESNRRGRSPSARPCRIQGAEEGRWPVSSVTWMPATYITQSARVVVGDCRWLLQEVVAKLGDLPITQAEDLHE